MLRRKPTAITLTSEDVAAYEDSRRAAADPDAAAKAQKQGGVVDPNDELKPLPGEKARIVRTREERIGSCPIPSSLPTCTSTKLRLLRRCTLVLSDPTQNHRLSKLATHYDLVAIRPTNAAALQQACQHLDNIALISLDLTVRHPYHFKHSLCRSATARGVRFELCYAPAVLAGDAAARRNLIANATQLIRATRGRGLVFSSETRGPVGARAPLDVANLGVVWGLGPERARDGLAGEPRAVVALAEMRRRSWRGVIDVVHGGDSAASADGTPGPARAKRKAEAEDGGEAAPPALSKRAAKKARQMQMHKEKEEKGLASRPAEGADGDESAMTAPAPATATADR
ncbi:MAG: hypothetical protein M1832_004124 [Thelocarpon impressellum]|nr:MAG: hypothetical protein M1832_004124 [Thelocarpon impressellum]